MYPIARCSRSRSPRGFTLVELLVAVVLLGIVTAGIYRALLTNQRTYQAQTQRIDLQQNLRAALTILPAELRELDARDGDIIAMASNAITIRAMRLLGFLCAAPALAVGPLPGPVLQDAIINVANSPVYGPRDFAVGDSILVYYEGDEGTRNDDGWVTGDIKNIGAGNCPAPDGRAGRPFTVRLSFAAGQWDRTNAIQIGSPIRAYEVVTYRAYQAADGEYYIGQTRGGVQQPLIGPITATGLAFTYFDAAGAATAIPTQVASIGLRVTARTAQPVQGPGGALIRPADNVVTRVTLRNNPRW
jgi:prepilin-type N-terminal cleavage/methylation domain-containing protein